MLTLFAIPKPFRDQVGVIQRNAIKSWAMLRPACQIVLLGDDEGTVEMAKECGARHVPEVARNEFGTPLLDSVFAVAERVATNDVLCYVNADIMLMSDFTAAVTRLAGQKRFLMIGQRWDVDIDAPWDFEERDWENRLRSYVSNHGAFRDPYGPDYFVFTRGLWQTLPQLVLGRFFWEYWLIFRARSLSVPVVDATPCVMAIHQTHDYTHVKPGVWGPETRRNVELAGGPEHFFTVGDATHILTRQSLDPVMPSDLKAKRAYYRSRILARVGIDHYVAADIRAAWKAWVQAVTADPSVVSPRLLLLMAKSLLGSRMLRWSRRLRGRHSPRLTGTA
ncbi:MAG TPA: hypothetical protein VFP86_01850 [bacterium]|nr:hypothetical protein [bacterium]